MKGLSKTECQALIRSVGTHRARRPLSPLEVARLLRKALDAGAKLVECANELDIGPTQIRTFLKLLELTPEIQHLADWKGNKTATISFTALAQLARLCPADQNLVSTAILRHRMTSAEVIQLVQIMQRSGRPTSACIDDVLKLRPLVEVQHLFVGSIKSEIAKESVVLLQQAERDQLMARVLEGLFNGNYEASGRLGPREFTILSNHDLSALLGLDPDELESLVNRGLERRLGLSN